MIFPQGGVYMSLPKDFGKSYIDNRTERSGFPDTRQRREEIVAIFNSAHEALSELGFEPHTSILELAYEQLPEKFLPFLENGVVLGKLEDGEFHPIYLYLQSVVSFLGSADDFAIDQVSIRNKSPNLLPTVRMVTETNQRNLIPPSMMMTYVRSFAQSNLE
jgi:hypothetical protein